MTRYTRFTRTAALAASVFALGACSSAGGLGEVLGSVLGGGQQQQQQLAGSVRSVDTRNQQISIQQSNGQSVAVMYDANTKVIYQNTRYAVTNLESGDQVVARITTTQNNAYYTDSITVTQSVTTSTSGGTVDNNLQLLSGTVYSIDRANGAFVVDVGSGTRVTVSMPYSARSTDVQTYNNMRVGQNVRFYGVYLNTARVELRQFY
jgi:hypothetical protein